VELKLYNEDCLETLGRMENDFVDCSITSPPYNFGKDAIHLDEGKYTEHKDDLSSSDYFTWQKKIIEELIRVTKNEVFYNIQMISGNKLTLFQLIGNFSDKIKEVLIWDKGYGEPAMQPGVLNSVFEFIIVFSKKSADKRKFEREWRGTVDNIIRIKKHVNTTGIDHSAMFPLKLPRYIIQTFTNENDIVYDPFSGGATTLIAAHLEKRRWIGSELSKEYYEQSKKRMEPYLTQYSLFNSSL
jgi:site-specific DNA-methyltransferase (adenine-specific)